MKSKISIKEAVDIYQVSDSTIRKKIRDGSLKSDLVLVSGRKKHLLSTIELDQLYFRREQIAPACNNPAENPKSENSILHTAIISGIASGTATVIAPKILDFLSKLLGINDRKTDELNLLREHDEKNQETAKQKLISLIINEIHIEKQNINYANKVLNMVRACTNKLNEKKNKLTFSKRKLMTKKNELKITLNKINNQIQTKAKKARQNRQSKEFESVIKQVLFENLNKNRINDSNPKVLFSRLNNDIDRAFEKEKNKLIQTIKEDIDRAFEKEKNKKQKAEYSMLKIEFQLKEKNRHGKWVHEKLISLEKNDHKLQSEIKASEATVKSLKRMLRNLNVKNNIPKKKETIQNDINEIKKRFQKLENSTLKLQKEIKNRNQLLENFFNETQEISQEANEMIKQLYHCIERIKKKVSTLFGGEDLQKTINEINKSIKNIFSPY